MDEDYSPEIKQTRADKIFFAGFFGAIILVIIITFSRYFIFKDYFILAQADCDPETEKCFVSTCSPDTDSECPENEAERDSYYKTIKKKAFTVPLCDQKSPDCPRLNCASEEDCEETLCDEANVPEGEKCNDPEEYLKAKAAAEEKADSQTEGVCVEGDDTCNATDENSSDTATDPAGDATQTDPSGN